MCRVTECVIKSHSRNTAENARFTKRLIAPRPGDHWLLITSAMHMPRAVGAFRAAGFSVEPYPVDYQFEGWRALIRLPPFGMERTDAAVHEWLGLFGYWITGRIPQLFPGPTSKSFGWPKALYDPAISRPGRRLFGVRRDHSRVIDRGQPTVRHSDDIDRIADPTVRAHARGDVLDAVHRALAQPDRGRSQRLSATCCFCGCVAICAGFGVAGDVDFMLQLLVGLWILPGGCAAGHGVAGVL